ncbi:MAG: hypothetical protein DRG69_09390 [Deltaproteobacteria bacterium]|nr:MAG: hypothetical protein DRG69_09390 [Deltaproteobacteria bacterium]
MTRAKNQSFGCGLWNTTRNIIAVIVDNQGNTKPHISIAKSYKAYWAFFVWLKERYDPIVVCTDDLLDDRKIYNLITDNRFQLCIIDSRYAAGIRVATGLSKRAAKFSAAFLARIPMTKSIAEVLVVNDRTKQQQQNLLFE